MQMKRINNIIHVAWLFLGMMGGCTLIHEEPADCQLYTPEGKPYAYVSVGFRTGMNTSTRADDDPTGGEDGDDNQAGTAVENKIHDITLFFYVADGTDADKGVNSAATTRIAARHYFNSDQFTYQEGSKTATTEITAVEDLLVNTYYHVLAVVNAGDNFLSGKSDLTLGDLQTATATSIYNTVETNSYTKFLMASSDDEEDKMYVSPYNNERNPATARLSVERVSARVDYRASGNNTREAGVYDVKPSDDATSIGKAKITGTMLMNVLDAEAPSWLLKRVADSWESTDVEYLGKETYKGVASATASNYVIDAIENKSNDSFVPATYYKNFGYGDPTNADDISLAWEADANYTTLFTNEGYNCIGYPKENVNQQGDKALTTGVVFRAQYRPYINNDYLDENQTFFEYNGEVYATLEALMDGLYENSSNLPTWDNLKQTFTNTISTWESLRSSFIMALRDDPVGYRSYLISKSDEEGTAGSIPEEVKATLSWDYYLEHECFYKEVEGKAVVDYSESSDVPSGTTRRILHNISGMSTYKNGICYYTYWIKHANDQDKNNDLVGVKDKTGGVMEYAIVRNNLYKLDVTSITGPGGDIPGDRNVNVNVLVEDWIMLPEEDINLNPAVNTEEEGA